MAPKSAVVSIIPATAFLRVGGLRTRERWNRSDTMDAGPQTFMGNVCESSSPPPVVQSMGTSYQPRKANFRSTKAREVQDRSSVPK
mmetsp:Transcript_826/g.1071  ORF Transcript_826/g.1071 Transcript_826/m.1071 type:complete len:86 (-) Transcript_826:112-369(-)